MANKNERVCIHCGEVVKGNEEICPYCGLSVGATPNNVVDSSSDNKKNNTKSTSTKEGSIGNSIAKIVKDKDPKLILSIGILVLLLAAVIIAVILTKKTPVVVDDSTKGTIITKEELNKKFEVDIKDPVDANDINYLVENVKNRNDEFIDIPKISYKKTIADGITMDFILRIASSTEDIEDSIGLTNSKGDNVEFAYTPIMMTVICEDGTEVPVESKVALDDNNQEMRYMRALWYDNDKYYSMVTDNLYTREDFLQEVNRVIIANHEIGNFDDEFIEDEVATKSDAVNNLKLETEIEEEKTDEETKERNYIETEAEK